MLTTHKMNTQDIKKYIDNTFKNKSFKISEIKGDASNRKYYRALGHDQSYIVMDSMLEKRNFNNFIKYTKIFNDNSIRTPKIIHKDINNRILIIEDLGDLLFFDIINKDNLKKIYSDSIVNILNIQKIKARNVPQYKKERYFKESSFFLQWVLCEFCKLKISNQDTKKLLKSLNLIVSNINHNTNKLVHRDYHSKNLFFIQDETIIIDYQDAMYGSPLYDFVSLVNDCYRDIDENSLIFLKNFFIDGFNEDNRYNFSHDEFSHNFDLISAQRHLKASGIFCRLSVKFNRHNYLQHLKRTLGYIVHATSNYDNLQIINFFASEAMNTLDESDNISSR